MKRFTHQTRLTIQHPLVLCVRWSFPHYWHNVTKTFEVDGKSIQLEVLWLAGAVVPIVPIVLPIAPIVPIVPRGWLQVSPQTMGTVLHA